MRILVGQGSCGNAAGANKVYDVLAEGLKERGIKADLLSTGCIGACYLEPIVEVIGDGGEKSTYVKVNADAAAEIVDKHLSGGAPVEGLLMQPEDVKTLGSQTKIALRNCGVINPEDISEYIAGGGYKAAEKCIAGLDADGVIDIIKESGLRGRGGAGFPTWFKWNAAKNSPGKTKYMVCNADEGDPGAFMDRAVLEGDPHSVLEGVLIGGYAIGAREGIIYVRAEYPLAIKRLNIAIKQAADAGFLGKNLFGTDYSFDIRIKAGAGAFVCGEETALIASLEGERGMPRLKPPFPAERGYWQKPTNINNVETYANVPWIVLNGGAAFAAMGTDKSKGTKVFALTGKIKKGGLVEIPMGRTLREIIYGIGGGIKDGREFKAVQMGGPSGGCIPAALIDTPVTYEDIPATGAIVGSGGMVVMDDTTCMVDMARFFLDFTEKESCGKCNFCRIGTKRMLEILNRIVAGDGRSGDIELLEELSERIKDGSMCALGQTAPNPVLTTLRYFRNEYEDHIYNKKCTAKSCRALLTFTIDAPKCKGCTLCSKNCPVGAISGEVKNPHLIDNDKCIGCGKCKTVCKFDAVEVS
ncbi:MAG: NADH-quinone oxidoreductase subunit NuoF [Oscillospiraceae bacterium]|nr:NADH-quinone oxidoreductase subunit NuoF [Oscillospiraceae bacterium]